MIRDATAAHLLTLAMLTGFISIAHAQPMSPELSTFLGELRAEGAGPFDATRAAAMWSREYTDATTGAARRCADCHTEDLTVEGSHVKTGKRIEPLAASANPNRLTDPRKIRKWFKRNCTWTLGRTCTPQEQGDFLIYINGNGPSQEHN